MAESNGDLVSNMVAAAVAGGFGALIRPTATKVEEHDMGWKRIALDFKELNGKGVKVGLMGGQEVDGTSVVDIGVYNEYGTKNIPARPFMGTTADRYRDAIYKYTETLVGQMIDGKYTVHQVLSYMGLWYQAKIQTVIREAKTWAVPNVPATIARKGSSSPLIDTGRMVGSIRYEIVSSTGSE